MLISKKFGLSVLVGALLAFAVPVQAATFDFRAIADGATFMSTEGAKTGAEGNWNFEDNGGSPAIVGDGAGIIADGVTLFAQGSNSGNKPADAFFDAGHAGLGVCSSASCKTGVRGAKTADDNLNRTTESLSFLFDQTVRLLGMSIDNADHNPANGDFTFSGSVLQIVNGIVDPAGLAKSGPSRMFTLGYLTDGPEIYVSSLTVSPVPLPAAGLLLIGGLAGLGAFRLRRRGA